MGGQREGFFVSDLLNRGGIATKRLGLRIDGGAGGQFRQGDEGGAVGGDRHRRPHGGRRRDVQQMGVGRPGIVLVLGVSQASEHGHETTTS